MIYDEPQKLDGQVWDPLVRLTHWGVAAAVLLNGLIVEEESQAHIWIGYAAFALVGLRLVWGLVGSDEARFSAFPLSLSAARAHARAILGGRHPAPHRSHNPLGALMVYALWATLLAVSVTGVMLDDGGAGERAAIVAPAYADEDDDEREGGRGEAEDDEEGESALEEIHETFANLLFVLAGLHVAGVAFETRTSGVNLVGAMINGEKRRRGAE
jgi:cytochrome b